MNNKKNAILLATTISISSLTLSACNINDSDNINTEYSLTILKEEVFTTLIPVATMVSGYMIYHLKIENDKENSELKKVKKYKRK